MSLKRVAVIGAGVSGIIAIKCLKEEEIQPTCFEKLGYFGGLWHYEDSDVEGVASVMKTTIINTSKEISAFSDFPPLDDMPNYMLHRELLRYLTLYAEHFDLLKHIHYYMKVIKVDFAPDYETTGKLTVQIKNTLSLEVFEDIYDGVMVCNGHNAYPKIPKFYGQDAFRGNILHTHSLKTVEQFTDQVVAVVGIGNSGIDAAVEISSVSKQVYLSTRSGTWLWPRMGHSGRPVDVCVLSRFYHFFYDMLPYSVSCSFLEFLLNRWFDHAVFGLKPNHRVFGQHVTVSDTLPVKLLSGTVKIKKGVVRFTEEGVLFENDTEATKLDAVVLATGYDLKFSFLSNDLIVLKNSEVQLYKLMFPPGLKHNTFAMIGLIDPIGPFLPCCENQARLASLVITGKIILPSKQQMEKDIYRKCQANRKRFMHTKNSIIYEDYMLYIDELSDIFGSKPNLWKLFVTDPVLWYHITFGPLLPYQYRLSGPHAWSGAREAILHCQKRIVKPLQTCYDSETEVGVIRRLIRVFFMILSGTVIRILY